ncbi:hypothetical protein J6590_040319 [Homalodisca vitripennis]|nr:hypothetical protein J6590_040319 [Homalodisca vitripennis]
MKNKPTQRIIPIEGPFIEYKEGITSAFNPMPATPVRCTSCVAYYLGAWHIDHQVRYYAPGLYAIYAVQRHVVVWTLDGRRSL